VTSRDQIARLAKLTNPCLGHLNVRSRSRRGKEGNTVICNTPDSASLGISANMCV
jgi:hypothetical protein